MDELEVLEMADDGPAPLRSRPPHELLRMVMRGQPCWVCGKPPVVLAKFREEYKGASATMHLCECKEHWMEARNHPHYIGAEEL